MPSLQADRVSNAEAAYRSLRRARSRRRWRKLTCAARKSSQVRRPTAPSWAKIAPARTARAAWPGSRTGMISRRRPTGLKIAADQLLQLIHPWPGQIRHQARGLANCELHQPSRDVPRVDRLAPNVRTEPVSRAAWRAAAQPSRSGRRTGWPAASSRARRSRPPRAQRRAWIRSSRTSPGRCRSRPGRGRPRQPRCTPDGERRPATRRDQVLGLVPRRPCCSLHSARWFRRPTAAASIPSPVARSPTTNSTPSAPSRLRRLSTRTS